MRHCKKQRHPFDHLTRTSMVAHDKRRDQWTSYPTRDARAMYCKVKSNVRAKWRNWEFCMSRVCNSRYHY